MRASWLLIFSAVGLALLGLNRYRKSARGKALAAVAKKHDFIFTPHAPGGLLAYSFPLFFRGDGRTADHGIQGRWKDMPFKAADFHQYENLGLRSAGQSKKEGLIFHHFSVAATDLPSWLPETRIHRETAISGFFDSLAERDIEFESDAFNRTFRVMSEDRKFAFALIDIQMMQWLLSCDPRFCFEIRGRGILVFAKQLKPNELVPLIGTLKEFRDRIPRMVLRNYEYLKPADS